MSGVIKIDGKGYELFSENSSSDIALSSFSGYLGFTGEIAAQYGGTPGKMVSVVFAVSGGVISGVFDTELHPLKEYDNIIGTALAGYAAGEIGAAAGGVIGSVIGGLVTGTEAGATAGGPIGAIVGALAGAVLGGLYGDDIYDNGEKLIEALANNLSDSFEYFDTTIYGEVTPKEYMLQNLKGDSKYCMRMFPKHLRYRQITKIVNGPTMKDFILYDKGAKKAEIKTPQQEKEYTKLVLTTAEDVEKLTINNHTTKVVHPSKNLQLRNALYAIDDYQSMLNPWLADKGWIGGSRVNNIGYRRKEVG